MKPCALSGSRLPITKTLTETPLGLRSEMLEKNRKPLHRDRESMRTLYEMNQAFLDAEIRVSTALGGACALTVAVSVRAYAFGNSFH